MYSKHRDEIIKIVPMFDKINATDNLGQFCEVNWTYYICPLFVKDTTRH